MKSWSPLGWKTLTEITWSNSPAHAGLGGAGCTGLCPFGFWVSSGMESLQSLQATCSSVDDPHSGGHFLVF